MTIFKSGHRRRFRGIRIVFPPSNPQFGREIQRADESTSTGNPSTKSTERRIIGILQPGNYSFFDPIQDRKFYRNRHVRQGYDAGTWSTWQCAIPAPIDFPITDTPKREGAARASRALNRSYPITKTKRIQTTSGQPQDSTMSWSFFNGYVQSGSTNVLVWRVSPQLPVGTTLIDVALRFRRALTGEVAQGRLWQATDTGGATAVGGVITSTSTGWHTISSTFNHVISTDSYYLNCTLNPDTSASNPRLVWVQFKYQVDRADDSL